MRGDRAAAYLSGLPDARAAELARVNGPGLAALRACLASGEAVAFLGAGASAPLYPLWDGLIRELVDAAAGRLDEREAATCRAMARQSPEEVVEIVRQSLGAGVLATQTHASDLAALRTELEAAARTHARVGRVLGFYAEKLAEPDRYLLAAVSLFARPVEPAAVLALAGHEVFGDRLAGWTPAMVQAAVRDRLSGLAAWHPDGTISAHPLVRDTFRPLVLAAADTAAEAAIAGVPYGTVTSRADALLVVEAIELLLDAGHWHPSDDLYKTRCNDGYAWMDLPAARPGQRAATAFVATSGRRAACAAHLGAGRLIFYLNEVGLFAMLTGDLLIAREYLPRVIDRARGAEFARTLAAGLQNLSQCLGQLGQVGPARNAAEEALTHAKTVQDRRLACGVQAWLGWLASLAGDAADAEQQFTAAGQAEINRGRQSTHLYSTRGIWWADWLIRTWRLGPARALTVHNASLCQFNGWPEGTARCDRILGRIALIAGDTAAAGEHLKAAVECFRSGDYLIDLAATLTDLADYAQASGDTNAADRHAAEAITIAAPRGLVPAQSTALAARARIRAAQATAAADPDLVFQGRDAADAALRLAVRHQLAWHELDALRAHAALDDAEGVDHGWAARAEALHSRLVPPGLDPDPLATVERLVIDKRAKAADREERAD